MFKLSPSCKKALTMSDSVFRALRDGALEGEHATALTIKDSIASPLGSGVFSQFLSQIYSSILAGKSQSRLVSILSFKQQHCWSWNFFFFFFIVWFTFWFFFYSGCRNRGLVLVAFSRSPSFYTDLLKRRGLDVSPSQKWLAKKKNIFFSFHSLQLVVQVLYRTEFWLVTNYIYMQWNCIAFGFWTVIRTLSGGKKVSLTKLPK